MPTCFLRYLLKRRHAPLWLRHAPLTLCYEPRRLRQLGSLLSEAWVNLRRA